MTHPTILDHVVLRENVSMSDVAGILNKCKGSELEHETLDVVEVGGVFVEDVFDFFGSFDVHLGTHRKLEADKGGLHALTIIEVLLREGYFLDLGPRLRCANPAHVPVEVSLPVFQHCEGKADALPRNEDADVKHACLLKALTRHDVTLLVDHWLKGFWIERFSVYHAEVQLVVYRL